MRTMAAGRVGVFLFFRLSTHPVHLLIVVPLSTESYEIYGTVARSSLLAASKQFTDKYFRRRLILNSCEMGLLNYLADECFGIYKRVCLYYFLSNFTKYKYLFFR